MDKTSLRSLGSFQHSRERNEKNTKTYTEYFDIITYNDPRIFQVIITSMEKVEGFQGAF